jgi:hypothetical protein
MIETLFAITAVSLVVAATTSVVAWRSISENRRRSDARVAQLSGVLRSAEPADSEPVDAPWLLESATAGGHTRRPLLLPLFLGGVIAALAIIAVAMRPDSADLQPPVQDTSSVPTPPASLELVSLTHERGPAGELELKGAVHNPQDGATLDDVTAVALLFDRQGTFVTSSRAPLEARSIAHGADATFFIRVPDADAVGRYRVSFRTSDRIVPHTDRRGTQ